MNPPRRRKRSMLLWALRRCSGALGAVALTCGCFLVLPVIQAIANTTKPDTLLQSVDSAFLPPPPPPPEPDAEPEEEEQDDPEPPPELDEGPPPDLSTLEMNIGGAGSGFAGPEINLNFDIAGGSQSNTDELFSLSQLDQTPRAKYTAEPVLGKKARRLVKKQAHQVYIKFIVDAEGKVRNPRVDSSTHPAFEAPALKAIKKWRFEPGKANGKAVSFRMRVPFDFEKSQ